MDTMNAAHDIEYIVTFVYVYPLYTEMVGCLNRYGSSMFQCNNQYI